MRGEPESGTRFQRGMSLKTKCRMLRMNDDPHEEFGEPDMSRDEGICDNRSSGRLVGIRARVGLRIHRAGTESAAVPASEKRTKGHRQEFPGQGDRQQSGADDPPDPALDPDAADRAGTGASAQFPAALYRRRY